MFGRPKKNDPREVEQHISIGTLRHARGVEPLDYVSPSDAEFEAALLLRLERLIDAGATDVETIAVLDEEIIGRERIDHDALEQQRVTHTKVCKSIVDVARMNLTQAENSLTRATTRLDRAKKALDALDAKLDSRDPEHNYHV